MQGGRARLLAAERGVEALASGVAGAGRHLAGQHDGGEGAARDVEAAQRDADPVRGRPGCGESGHVLPVSSILHLEGTDYRYTP